MAEIIFLKNLNFHIRSRRSPSRYLTFSRDHAARRQPCAQNERQVPLRTRRILKDEYKKIIKLYPHVLGQSSLTASCSKREKLEVYYRGNNREKNWEKLKHSFSSIPWASQNSPAVLIVMPWQKIKSLFYRCGTPRFKTDELIIIN